MVNPILLGFLGGILLIVLLFTKCRRPHNYPPGPKGLPLIGYIPFLRRLDPKPYVAMVKLSKTYGPVTAFYLGPRQLVVSVCGYQAVREALHNEDLNGRPDTAARRERTFGKRLGLMFVDGEFSREQRRFTLRHLRDLGFGKSSMEDKIHEEIRESIQIIREELTADPDHVVKFKNMFNQPTLNLMWSLIAGERFKRGDARLKDLLEMIDFVNRSFKPLTSSLAVPKFILNLFPFIRKLIGIRNDLCGPLQDFIRTTIEDHAQNKAEDGCPRDFIDVYLQEIEKQKPINPNTSFHEEQLISSIVDLFLAGSETSSNTISFALLYLLHHPNVQQKMQIELDTVCGDALPSLVHRPNLVYTEAVLMETLRLSTVAPFGIVHSAFNDTELRGHFIPKGSIVLMNMYSVNTDENCWTDPHEFRPERHLDSDCLRLVKPDHLMPFGSGKLACLGEPLARNTVFLFITAIVKAFKIQAVPDKPLPTLEPLIGVTNAPQEFSAIITPRF